jgi:predicted O-methyltransferase YrrM
LFIFQKIFQNSDKLRSVFFFREIFLSILTSLFKDIFTSKNRIEAGSVQNDISPQSFYDAGIKCLEYRDIAGAEAVYAECLQVFPGHPKARDLQFAIHSVTLQLRFPGPNYLKWLEWFHATLRPQNYVEIGVESGQSLQNARPPTRAIGIDPALEINCGQQAWVKLFKLPSDDFFQQHNLAEVLGAESVDLAFIDGLHTFDQALKDFINIERFSSPTTVVLFHDILPHIPLTVQREPASKLWLGDTWKAIAMLLKYRPDLNIFTIPTSPSGLAVVTNLDRGNDSLQRNFDNIFEEAMALDVESYLPDIERRLNVTANDFGLVKSQLEARKP